MINNYTSHGQFARQRDLGSLSVSLNTWYRTKNEVHEEKGSTKQRLEYIEFAKKLGEK